MARVALVQFQGSRDRDANLEKILRFGREAAEGGAEVICFPELATTMYFCHEEDDAYKDWAESDRNAVADRVAELARETGTTIVLPFYERAADGRLFNTAVLIGPDGETIGKYRKSSIPRMPRSANPTDGSSNEQYYFEAGDLGFPVFETAAGIRVGLLICYDRHFPEAARVLALGGADVILIPTATYRAWIQESWEIELRAHAIANSVFVGGVNKVGADVDGAEGRPHFGGSLFIDPRGRVVVRADNESDMIIYGEVNRAQVEDTRDLWGFFRERRPEQYGSLVDGSLVEPHRPE
jgi:N-carbamoylputrescine amidase